MDTLIRLEHDREMKFPGFLVNRKVNEICPGCFLNRVEQKLYKNRIIGPENEIILSFLERSIRPSKDNLSDKDCPLCGLRKLRFEIYDVVTVAKDGIEKAIYKDFDVIFKSEPWAA